jgi:putative ABC transport system ATP-binding protein
MANNPRILLADEPTGNLDSRNGRHIIDLLLRINRERGATLVLVTHDQQLADLADRRISFRDGSIVEDVRRYPSTCQMRQSESGGLMKFSLNRSPGARYAPRGTD